MSVGVGRHYTGCCSQSQGQERTPARVDPRQPKVTIPEEEELSRAGIRERVEMGLERDFELESSYSELSDFGQRSTRWHFHELHSCIR